MSDGLVGNVALILTDAAILAIEARVEEITPEILDAIGWTSPSEQVIEAAKQLAV